MSRAYPEEPRFDGMLGDTRCTGLPLIRTLSDEYHDTPEPEDSGRVPPPAPRGRLRRAVEQLARRRPEGTPRAPRP
jgi:hypothetical protein